MGPLTRSFLTAISTMPVLIVLRTFMPEPLEWWEGTSAGFVAAMLATHWLRNLERD